MSLGSSKALLCILPSPLSEGGADVSHDVSIVIVEAENYTIAMAS